MDELRVSSQVWELGEKNGASSSVQFWAKAAVFHMYSRENRSALYWGENSEGLQTEV